MSTQWLKSLIRIEERVARLFANAVRQGGAAEEAADEHLEPALSSVRAVRRAYEDAERDFAHAAATAARVDARVRGAVVRVHEEMKAACGPSLSGRARLLPVFPEGPGAFAAALPSGRDAWTAALCRRIRGAAAPPWSEAQSAAWAARIEVARTPLAGTFGAVCAAARRRATARAAAVQSVLGLMHALASYQRVVSARGQIAVAVRRLVSAITERLLLAA